MRKMVIIFVSFFPSRLVDLPISLSPSQPKTDRGGLSVTRHLPAQTSWPVFLIYFLLRLPATTQDSQGDLLCLLRFCVVTVREASNGNVILVYLFNPELDVQWSCRLCICFIFYFHMNQNVCAEDKVIYYLLLL